MTSRVLLDTNPSSLRHELLVHIPREDLLIFLTALLGNTTLFISGNREFIRAVALQQQLFLCFTPEEFLAHSNL